MENLPFHKYIRSAEDLVTTKAQALRSWSLLAFARENCRLASSYVEEAKVLKWLASKFANPMDLLESSDLRKALLTCSGIPEEWQKQLTEEDKTLAIKGFIYEFLLPTVERFPDELAYRYLLTKGDALGGKARNLAGTLGERKFLRALLSVLNLAGVHYQWKDANLWHDKKEGDAGIENSLKGLYWSKDSKHRLLILNASVPTVQKNVDLSLLVGTISDLKKGKESILHDPARYVALGELKGGFDPAGADEHWKTANSALNRIKSSFGQLQLNPHTFFVAAAIENSMATEIFTQLQNRTLSHAANLTHDEQLTGVCDWLVNL